MAESQTDATDAPTQTTDPRLVVLREAFYQDGYTVEGHRGDALGDYSVESNNGHIGGQRFTTINRLGFDVESVHAHGGDEEGDEPTTTLYLDDVRGPADANDEEADR